MITKIILEGSEKQGLVCLNSILNSATEEEIRSFARLYKIEIPLDEVRRSEFLRRVYIALYSKYTFDIKLKQQYQNAQEYMGALILNFPEFSNYLQIFDFIAKQDLISVFADYCADLGISVFDASRVEEYDLSLYLTKKTPLLKTEAVFVYTGQELKYIYGSEFLNKMRNALKISHWILLVTTPLGAIHVGFDRLIKDMNMLNAWLYILDPVNKRILGITKGKTSKEKDDTSRDKYILKLPSQPIRAPSQVVKISKYSFDERTSYNSKDFQLFSACRNNLYASPEAEPAKYRSIFRQLLIFEQKTGLTLYSYANEIAKLDENLISAFLYAMDTFVSSIGGESSLKEIEYKGFFAYGAYGKSVKGVIFLAERPDEALKQRLNLLIKDFEEKYESAIENFTKTGNLSGFHRKEIMARVKNILAI